jgi:hypothetical protein
LQTSVPVNGAAIAIEVAFTTENASSVQLLPASLISCKHMFVGSLLVHFDMPTAKRMLNAVQSAGRGIEYQLPPDTVAFSTGARLCRQNVSQPT